MLTLKLAWRNIWRSPRRTLLTLLAIAFATGILMFFMGLQLKSYDAAVNATTSLYHGHLQVQVEGYLDKPQLEKSLAGATELQATLKEIPEILAISRRSMAFALASSEDRSFGVQIVGIDPDAEPTVSTIAQAVKSGTYLNTKDPQGALIGATLAKNLKVQIGSELSLLGQGRDGSLAASVVRIAGIFNSGSKDLDRMILQIPISSFDEIFSMQGSAHALVIKVRDFTKIEEVQIKLTQVLKKISPASQAVSALRWDELLPGLKQSIQLDMSAGWLFFSSLVIIVAFCILNTFLMAVLERTREFGIMLSLGSSSRLLAQLVMVESLFLSVLGVILGMLAGCTVIQYFGQHGFSVPGTDEIMRQWNLPGTIYPEVTLRVLSTGPIVILIAAFVSILYPVIKVLQIRPLEGIRNA